MVDRPRSKRDDSCGECQGSGLRPGWTSLPITQPKHCTVCGGSGKAPRLDLVLEMNHGGQCCGCAPLLRGKVKELEVAVGVWEEAANKWESQARKTLEDVVEVATDRDTYKEKWLRANGYIARVEELEGILPTLEELEAFVAHYRTPPPENHICGTDGQCDGECVNHAHESELYTNLRKAIGIVRRKETADARPNRPD